MSKIRTCITCQMINFIVVSSDLQPYRVKRGAELSTDHHLVASWFGWKWRMPDKLRPKRAVNV